MIGFRPLAGCKLFRCLRTMDRCRFSFRPLTGCELFRVVHGKYMSKTVFSSPSGA